MCERKVALGLLVVVPWLTQGPGSVARAQCPTGPFDVISPNAMAIADLNQDGHEDCVVVASGSANEVTVLAGDGAGGFCPGPPVLVFDAPTGITLGDWNGDGNLDAAVSHWGIQGNTSRVTVLLGRGNGTLEVSTVYSWGYRNETVTTDDFNEDGIPDLLVASFGTGEIGVFLGRGDGTFDVPTAERVFATGAGPTALCVRDFNQDGHADVAVTNKDEGTLTVLSGDGAGGFATPGETYNLGVGARWCTALDFTGDGVLDLAIANGRDGTVCTLVGRGDGRFDRDLCYAVGRGPRWIVAGDITGDGVVDLIVANYLSASLTVLPAKLTSGFCSGYSLAVGEGPDALGIGDWNRDGRPDLIVGGKIGARIEVLANSALQTGIDEMCPPDCNQDGLDDTTAILNGISSDCNGNGVPDECDLSAGTSLDRDDDGTPDECRPPALLDVADGLGGVNESTGLADTFISPLGENTPLTAFTLEATEPLRLNRVVRTYTGSGPVPGVTLVDQGGGRHTVTLAPGPEPGEWLRLELEVTGKNTGFEATLSVWVAHHPCNITQDDIVNIRDATEFANELRQAMDPRLTDMNGDGQVNVRDATVFAENWSGVGFLRRPWKNTQLPIKPE